MKKLVIVKSVRLHPSRENKYLAGREVVKMKRSFYGQDNRKGQRDRKKTVFYDFPYQGRNRS